MEDFAAFEYIEMFGGGYKYVTRCRRKNIITVSEQPCEKALAPPKNPGFISSMLEISPVMKKQKTCKLVAGN